MSLISIILHMVKSWTLLKDPDENNYFNCIIPQLKLHLWVESYSDHRRTSRLSSTRNKIIIFAKFV